MIDMLKEHKDVRVVLLLVLFVAAALLSGCVQPKQNVEVRVAQNIQRVIQFNNCKIDAAGAQYVCHVTNTHSSPYSLRSFSTISKTPSNVTLDKSRLGYGNDQLEAGETLVVTLQTGLEQHKDGSAIIHVVLNQ